MVILFEIVRYVVVTDAICYDMILFEIVSYTAVTDEIYYDYDLV